MASQCATGMCWLLRSIFHPYGLLSATRYTDYIGYDRPEERCGRGALTRNAFGFYWNIFLYKNGKANSPTFVFAKSDRRIVT
jgi:hypothetical protein